MSKKTKRKYETVRLEIPDIESCQTVASALRSGLDPNSVLEGDTLFERAMNMHATDTAELLVDHPCFDPENPSSGLTPLVSAMLSCEYKIAEKLVKRGADLFAVGLSKRNVLHSVSSITDGSEVSGLSSLMQLLLRKGCGWNLYSKDIAGETPRSCMSHGKSIRQLLVDMDEQHRKLCVAALSDVVGVTALVGIAAGYLFGKNV